MKNIQVWWRGESWYGDDLKEFESWQDACDFMKVKIDLGFQITGVCYVTE